MQKFKSFTHDVKWDICGGQKKRPKHHSQHRLPPGNEANQLSPPPRGKPQNGRAEEHSGHDVAAHPRGFQKVGDLSTHIATEKEEPYVE